MKTSVKGVKLFPIPIQRGRIAFAAAELHTEHHCGYKKVFIACPIKKVESISFSAKSHTMHISAYTLYRAKFQYILY